MKKTLLTVKNKQRKRFVFGQLSVVCVVDLIFHDNILTLCYFIKFILSKTHSNGTEIEKYWEILKCRKEKWDAMIYRSQTHISFAIRQRKHLRSLSWEN